MSSGSESTNSREELLQSHVARLKEDLERERAEKRQIHHDKVREIKTAREKEQANAREQLENLKVKLQKEKAKELLEQRDQLSRELDQRIRTLEKQYEDQIRDLKHVHSVEKQELVEKLRIEINQEVEEALGSKYEAERRKMHYQMFETQQQLSALEEKNADLMDTDRNTVTVLKDMEKQHRNEIEKLNKQHRLALKKQMEELDAVNRKVQSKDKELAKLTERLSRTEADRDKLQDEVKQLKQAESWTRRSTTPPSLSPSSSMNDLVSKRERDMVMKNSELSFRVRTLEDGIAQLRQEKSKLQAKLSESRQQLAPLEEQKVKLSHRINDLNSSLRSREKKIEQLSKIVLELKSGKQQLEEETARQRKSLQQQMSISSSHRAEKEKLKAKNTKLQQANTSLREKLETLMSENSPPPMSPMSPSSTPDTNSPLSSSANSSVLMEQLDQLQFDKEESIVKCEELQAKYEEMKGEYIDLRDKYKKVRSKYEDVQGKYRDMQANCTLLEEKLRLLEKEHRELEREVVMLRRPGKISPSHDVQRFETILDSLQKQLEDKESRICELEDFIVEQDEVAIKSEESLKREKTELQVKLTGRYEGLALDMEQLNKQVNDLQTELERANELLKSKEEEIEEFQGKLSSFGERSGIVKDGDAAGSPLSVAQLERCVQQYKTQIMQLDEKNVGLQRDLADAIAQVSQLQELTVELEGRMEEDHTAHEEVVAGRDEEIDLLNQRLTQLETKLIKLSRELPFDPSHKDITPLADKVYEAIAKVRQAVSGDSDMLNSAVVSLEDAINELIHTIIPAYAPMLPPSSPLSSSGTSLQPTNVLASTTPISLAPPLPVSSPPATPAPPLHVLSPLGSPAPPPPTSSPPASPAPPPPVSSPPTSPGPPPPISPTSILKISSDFTELPLSYRTVFADTPATQDSWSQTKPPLSLHQSKPTASARRAVEDGSQITVSTERPKIVDSSTQTPQVNKAKVKEQHSQTSPPRRTVSVEKATQTVSARTPRRVDRSSQTTSREKAVNNSTQTPQAWRRDVRQTTTPSSSRSPDAVKYSPFLKAGELQNGYSSHQSQPHSRENGHAHIHNGPLNSTWTQHSFSQHLSDDEGERRSNGVLEEFPRVFVAVMDYDPNSLCTTGRPDLELTVHTGDVVCVEGDMDESGYYRASFAGLTGLLPANFIQETEVANLTTRERLFNQSLSLNWSASSSPVSGKSQQKLPLTHSQLSRDGSVSSPQAPLSFQVEKVLGHNGLLVAWQPPPMDSMCCSNGCLVTGYQLYVNGQTKTLVSGASQCRTLLSGLSLTKTLQLGISTSSVEGKSSKVVEIVYRGRPISISRTSPEPEKYRTFVALYDYNPAKCSPSDNPEFELSFKEGDLILVHGQEKDGFLVGEVNGKQGWVPATFVTQVSGPSDHAKSQVLSPTDHREAHLTTSRRMLALYDYDPLHVSPNPNPDAELAFHAGDIITVYGYMSDGFYSGELNGRCGLVPSNFLRDIQHSDTQKSLS